MLLASTVINLTTTKAKGTNMEIYMAVFSDSVAEVAVQSLENFPQFYINDRPIAKRIYHFFPYTSQYMSTNTSAAPNTTAVICRTSIFTVYYAVS